MVTKGGTIWKHQGLLASKVGKPKEIVRSELSSASSVVWRKKVTVRVGHLLFTHKHRQKTAQRSVRLRKTFWSRLVLQTRRENLF